MAIKFVVDDDLHSEGISTHDSYAEALAKIESLSLLPWDQEPNAAPCTNWRNCGRRYEIAEYMVNDSNQWEELNRTRILELSAAGTIWLAPSQPRP